MEVMLQLYLHNAGFHGWFYGLCAKLHLSFDVKLLQQH